MNIQPYLATLSDEDLIKATKEFKLIVIPDDAIIRHLALAIYGDDTVMHMIPMLAPEIAIQLAERLKNK